MTTKMKMKMRTTTMMTRKIMMMTLTRIKNWWKWWWGQRWQWQRKGRWLTAGKSFSADTDNPGCDCYPLLRRESRERKQKGWSWSYCHRLWNWQVCILHTAYYLVPQHPVTWIQRKSHRFGQGAHVDWGKIEQDPVGLVLTWWARYLVQKMHGHPKPQFFSLDGHRTQY